MSHDPENWQTVHVTSDPNLLPIIKSVLDGAGIPFTTDGEGLLDLFPTEHLTPVTQSGTGEVKIRVPDDRAVEARALLEQQDSPADR